MGSAGGMVAGRRRAAELSRHALRTPLLAIRGTAELLLAGAGGPLAPTARELLAASGAAAMRLERLIEPLLKLAERAGAPAPPIEAFDPAAVLREAGVELLAIWPRPAPGRGPAGGAAGADEQTEPAVLLRGGRASFAELLELMALILGPPLVAELAFGGRSGAVLVTLEGRGAEPCGEDERPLLRGLAARLARLAGARLVLPERPQLGVVLKPACRSPVRPGPGGAGWRGGGRFSPGRDPAVDGHRAARGGAALGEPGQGSAAPRRHPARERAGGAGGIASWWPDA